MKKYLGIFLLIQFTACQNTQKNEVQNRDEQFRPQIHFSPKAHWMNDPNGLIYNDEIYHLFFQYYPEASVWGPMHWGHATSNDLVHWEEKEIALYPDSLGYIFSGSAVLDHKNLSGLGSIENPPMVAIFTYHDPVGREAKTMKYENQGIAYSLDNGISWTKYQKNPVLKNPGITDFRDPKVIWYAPKNKWIMTLAVKDRVSFYSSPNLIDWDFESDFGVAIGAHGGVWECPDLFPLNDSEGNEKWVLLSSINPGGLQGGSATQYFVGTFDGTTFIPDDEDIRWIDQGADNYAGVTFSNIPKEDGRRIFIGWMSNWSYAQNVPTKKWRSAMTLPRALSLFTDLNGKTQIQSQPISELSKIEKETQAIVAPETTVDAAVYKLHLSEINPPILIRFQNDYGEFSTLEFKERQVVFDRSSSGEVAFNASFSSKHSFDISDIELKNVSLYVDKASFEIFLNDGEKVMTEIVFPTEPYNKIILDTKNVQASLTPLESIWKSNPIK